MLSWLSSCWMSSDTAFLLVFGMEWKEGRRDEGPSFSVDEKLVILQSLSSVWFFAALWTVSSRQAPASMGFPGQSTGVGCHFLLQGMFPTQGSNWHLLLDRQILYHWATWQALDKVVGRKTPLTEGLKWMAARQLRTLWLLSGGLVSMNSHQSVLGALPWGPGAASWSFVFPVTLSEPPPEALGPAGWKEADESGSDRGCRGRLPSFATQSLWVRLGCHPQREESVLTVEEPCGMAFLGWDDVRTAWHAHSFPHRRDAGARTCRRTLCQCNRPRILATSLNVGNGLKMTLFTLGSLLAESKADCALCQSTGRLVCRLLLLSPCCSVRTLGWCRMLAQRE